MRPLSNDTIVRTETRPKITPSMILLDFLKTLVGGSAQQIGAHPTELTSGFMNLLRQATILIPAVPFTLSPH